MCHGVTHTACPRALPPTFTTPYLPLYAMCLPTAFTTLPWSLCHFTAMPFAMTFLGAATHCRCCVATMPMPCYTPALPCYYHLPPHCLPHLPFARTHARLHTLYTYLCVPSRTPRLPTYTTPFCHRHTHTTHADHTHLCIHTFAAPAILPTHLLPYTAFHLAVCHCLWMHCHCAICLRACGLLPSFPHVCCFLALRLHTIPSPHMPFTCLYSSPSCLPTLYRTPPTAFYPFF